MNAQTINLNQLRTIKNNIIDIKSDDPIVISHFASSHSFTQAIISQFREMLYDRFFVGKKDLTILDCGGNIGLFALHVNECAKIVVSVEPTPNHGYVFKKLTNDYPNIRLVQAALSPKDEDIEFYFCNQNTTMNSIVNNYGQGSIKVKGKTLKTILADNGLDFVDFAKVDIEGSEMAAINDETISEVSNKIKSFFLEVHATADATLLQNRDKITSIFKNNGYSSENTGHDSAYYYR